MKPVDKGRIRPTMTGRSPPQFIKKTEIKKPLLKKQISATSIPEYKGEPKREYKGEAKGEYTKEEYMLLQKSISATSTRFSSSKDLNRAVQHKVTKEIRGEIRGDRINMQGDSFNPQLIIANKSSQKNSFTEGTGTPREYPSQRILGQQRVIAGGGKSKGMGERVQQRVQQRTQLKIIQRMTPKQPAFSKIMQSQHQYQSQYQSQMQPQMQSPSPPLFAQFQSNQLKQQIKKSLANVIKVYYPSKKQCLDTSVTSKTNIPHELSRLDFKFMEPIGEGGYGNVWRVQHLKTKRLYAMKQMSKALVIMKKSVDNILNERKILQHIKSPFIANMVCAFNDRDNIYLVMDLLPGGDLRSKMSYSSRFNQVQTKFLVCSIIVAIEAIHKHRIFHRDLKPENLVFDEKGYLRVTDFGIARLQNSKQLLDASGTPGYMAPQVLCKQIHAYEVDFYAIGVITHEMMTGKRPYPGNNRIDIRNAILSKQHSIKRQEIPPGWSLQSADFVNRLLMRQPSIRLGAKGISEVKQHPWFASVQWSDIENKKIKSPFPIKKTYFEISDRNDQYSESLMQYKLLQRSENMIDAFSQYYFPLKCNQ